ncbi:DUF6308 family protein [Kitasatospora sp. CB01950]|uniref:DUF6308 family protein n=1 Tax=Kitasatospora sp. CB01950 TaxID=1703930 RepID=UPI00093CFABB|nr:DUF6308 family protein [Kitasatospora sp. CB01950]OKJ09227.1 hypothetical protein AMK19_17790 [Kitasatospora sp. CB01950]
MEVKVGGRRATVAEATRWVGAYFDEEANTAAAAASGGKPYAYPVYDRLDTGSGPDRLDDGDLLAPLLLNAAPTIRAVFNLRAVRPALEAGLARIPEDLTLQAAVAEGSHRPLLAALTGVLDRPGGLPGVGGTTLMKVLHRKRPLFVPLYDSRIDACYRGSAAEHPIKPDRRRSWTEFFALLAEAVAEDLESQPEQWRTIAAAAPEDVSLLRVLDVVAWNRVRRGKPAGGRLRREAVSP